MPPDPCAGADGVPDLLPLTVTRHGGSECTCPCAKLLCACAVVQQQHQTPQSIAVTQSHTPRASVCLSVWQQHSFTPHRTVCVSDTVPVPKTSVWVCLILSLSHTHSSAANASRSGSHAPEDATRPCVPAMQPRGPHPAMTATHPGSVCRVSITHGHTPQTLV